MTTRTHQRLRCEAPLPGGGECQGAIGFFWERHAKVRRLERGEHARPGYDAVPCRDCGTRWEIVRVGAMAREAA